MSRSLHPRIMIRFPSKRSLVVVRPHRAFKLRQLDLVKRRAPPLLSSEELSEKGRLPRGRRIRVAKIGIVLNLPCLLLMRCRRHRLPLLTQVGRNVQWTLTSAMCVIISPSWSFSVCRLSILFQVIFWDVGLVVLGRESFEIFSFP